MPRFSINVRAAVNFAVAVAVIVVAGVAAWQATEIEAKAAADMYHVSRAVEWQQGAVAPVDGLKAGPTERSQAHELAAIVTHGGDQAAVSPVGPCDAGYREVAVAALCGQVMLMSTELYLAARQLEKLADEGKRWIAIAGLLAVMAAALFVWRARWWPRNGALRTPGPRPLGKAFR